MSLITKIPGVIFTDTSLPILLRDTVVTNGTKFLFDGLDEYSYSKQSAPTANVDVWRDLSEVNAVASFGSSVPFVNGGFVFSPSVASRTSAIQLPASGKNSATADGFLFVLWMKHLATGTGNYSGIAGICDSTVIGSHQYSIDCGAANSGVIRLVVDTVTYIVNPTIGAVYQFALSAKKQANGTYVVAQYINGLLKTSVNTTRTTLGQSALMSVPIIGAPPQGYSADAHFSAYRTFFDDTSTLADQAAITALVLKDYTANNGRFI